MELHLADVLTVAGAVAAAALITGLIALLKNLGRVGAWIEAGHEPIVAFLLSAILVAIAFVDVGTHTLDGAFAAVLAWYAIASLTSPMHDQVATRGASITDPGGGA